MTKRLLTLLLSLLSFSAAAYDDALIGLRLDWSQYDITLTTAGNSRDTRIDHVALVLNEPTWQRFYGGLRVGYVDISQADNPELAGFDLNGNSLGLRLGVFLIRNDHVNVFVQSDVDYLYAEDEQDGQKAELDWTETTLQIGTSVKLGPFRLSAGAYRYNLSGEQALRGPIDSTFRFSEEESTGATAGIEFQVDPTGYIGIHTESGARDGTRLTFIREF
jgi:hypothetical protein